MNIRRHILLHTYPCNFPWSTFPLPSMCHWTPFFICSWIYIWVSVQSLNSFFVCLWTISIWCCTGIVNCATYTNPGNQAFKGQFRLSMSMKFVSSSHPLVIFDWELQTNIMWWNISCIANMMINTSVIIVGVKQSALAPYAQSREAPTSNST
jgi:hypothetical protein